MRYLSTGDDQTTIAMAFRMSPTTVGRIIPETCKVICDVLIHEGYISVPSSEAQWRLIARDFGVRWNFNNCLGAIDVKHVLIQAPPNSGSMYFDYKKTFSIVLLAVCDAQYQFTMVDIGEAGRSSDGGIFANSCLGNAIINQTMGMPQSDNINGSTKKIPFVFVADDAFALKTNIMKPYPKEMTHKKERIFNYRLSRARHVIENVFGIMASRFRILRRPIIADVDTTLQITKSVVALHNYLMQQMQSESPNSYCPNGYVDSDSPQGMSDGRWREIAHDDQGLQSIRQLGSNNYSKSASTLWREMTFVIFLIQEMVQFHGSGRLLVIQLHTKTIFKHHKTILKF